MIGPRFFQFLWFGFLFWIISFSLKSLDSNETADPGFSSLFDFLGFEIKRFQ